MSETPYITVVMPALNEAGNIDDAVASVLQAADSFGLDLEIVVVNDGSTDATPEKVAAWSARDPRVRRIDHTAPMGIGRAFWDGVDQARGQNVVMLPGDNENDPAEIFRYATLLEHVDIVIPFLYNREARSLWRNVLSLLYRQIISSTFRVNFNYTNGTVLYRSSILRQLPYRSASFFFQTDMLVRLVKNGYLFAEVPYRIRQRGGGRSKAVSFPSLMKVIRGYIQLVKDIHFTKRPREEFTQDSRTRERRNGDSGPDGRNRPS